MVEFVREECKFQICFIEVSRNSQAFPLCINLWTIDDIVASCAGTRNFNINRFVVRTVKLMI